jgi:DNA-binding phage protein
MPKLSKSYEEHLSERLQKPKEAAAYLNAVMEDGDVAVICWRCVTLPRPGESGK